MNREEIIRMAREVEAEGFAPPNIWPEIVRLCELVAEQEREACAKVCEDIDTEYEGEDVLPTWCATAIRARGQA